MRKQSGENTRAVHLPAPPTPSQQPLGTPVYRTAAFAFDTAEEYRAVLNDEMPGYTYSRIDNPTVDAFARAVAALEGVNLPRWPAAQAFASGMAAVSGVFWTFAAAGTLMGVGRRQVFRLRRAFAADGASGLVSRERGRPSNRRRGATFRSTVLALIRERYADFGPTLAAEKLLGRHGLGVGGDAAAVDDRGRAVDRSATPPALPASAAPAARMPGRTGADRWLGARVVRGPWRDVHAAGFCG